MMAEVQSLSSIKKKVKDLIRRGPYKKEECVIDEEALIKELNLAEREARRRLMNGDFKGYQYYRRRRDAIKRILDRGGGER